MKKLIILICLLLLACPKHTPGDKGRPSIDQGPIRLANPAAALVRMESELYKKAHGIGFKYEFRNSEQGQTGVVIFPDSSECDEWDFFSGICGQKWSYCEQSGYNLISLSDSDDGYSRSFGVCVFPDSSRCKEFDFVSGDCEPPKK